MNRVLRIVLFGALGLLLLTFVGYIGLHFYLSSNSARQLAAAQLSKAFGSEVHVTALNSGVSGTTVGIEIPAAPAPDGTVAKAPLVAGTVNVDVSPLGLAAGTDPKAVTIDNARLTLRFNEHNDLIDKLPEPQGEGGGQVPTVRVRNATVRFVQAGKPDFTASGIDADLTPLGKKLAFTGTANDKFWGRWKANGEFDTAAAGGGFTVETEGPTRVTPEHLRALPFVPPETWDYVTLDGTTPCKVVVGRGADKKWTWHVECEPRDTKLTIPDAQLTTTETSGKVIVDGARVVLKDVTGKTAQGVIRADSDMDFGPTPSKLAFNVKADGLHVPELPKTWGFPAQFHEGRLKGRADITLLVDGKDVQYLGKGRGKIEGAKGLGVSGEIDLALRGTGRKIVFDVSQPGANRGGPSPVAQQLRQALFVALLLQQQPAPKTPDPKDPVKKDDPTTVQANLRLKDVDLAELLQQLQVNVPVALGGKVSLDVSAEIPVTAANSLRAYKVKGKLSSPQLQIEELRIRQATANIDFSEGVLTLTSLTGELPPASSGGEPGTFRGTARFGVEPRTDLTADLAVTNIPLGQLARAYPGLAGAASGPVSGSVSFKAPGDDLGNVSKYVGNGTLTSPGFTVYGRRASRTAVTLALDKGVARITDLTTAVEGLPVAGSASLTLSGKYPFEANVKIEPTDAVNVRKLAPEADLPVDVVGKIDTAATVTGTLNPLTYKAGGTATATGLTVGTARVEKLSFNWDVTERAVTLSDIRSELYRGGITGSAKFPLVPAEAGAFDVAFDKVDAAAVTRAVPSLPVKLGGKVTGSLKGTLPPTKGTEPRQASGSLDLTSDALTLNGLRVTGVTADVKYRPGFVDYKVAGKAASGTIESEGRYPLGKPKATELEAPKIPPQAVRTDGFLRLRGVQLSQIIEQVTRSPSPLRGVLNTNVTYALDPKTNAPTGGGRIEIGNFGWGHSGDAALMSDVRVTEDAIDLPEISGRFAEGTVRGRARYNLANPARSFYTLTIDGGDADAVFGSFGLGGKNSPFGGRFGLNMRGNLGREFRGSGTLVFQRAKVTGFDLADLRVPFDWSYDPVLGSRIAMRDFGGQFAGGRLNGEVSAAFGDTVTVEGRVKFVDLSFRTLLGKMGSSSGLGSGRMNGTFNFSGRNVRSVNDVTGLLVAQLGEGPVLDAPVFNRIAEYIVPSPGSQGGLVQFNGGELRARLAGGQFRVERLAMSGPKVQLFMEGTVGLTGRLDLDVVAVTNRIGLDPRVLRALGVRLPMVGPVPVGLILEVTSFLSNRTIRLRVTGTMDQPIVQVNIGQLLSEEAIRYFLNPYLPTPLQSGIP